MFVAVQCSATRCTHKLGLDGVTSRLEKAVIPCLTMLVPTPVKCQTGRHRFFANKNGTQRPIPLLFVPCLPCDCHSQDAHQPVLQTLDPLQDWLFLGQSLACIGLNNKQVWGRDKHFTSGEWAQGDTSSSFTGKRRYRSSGFVSLA